jgi:anthranilate synthase/aminodeoxychorismate synthase-like glutamine amidotransferase
VSPRIIVVENYYSFTFNLVQLVAALGADADVVRNDIESADALAARRPDGVVFAPGPGTPDRAGVTLEAVGRFAALGTPVLGVCLGHQAIGVRFGGHVVRAREPRHGKAASIAHDGIVCFDGLPARFDAALYHSLVLDPARMPATLCVSARSPEGEVMGVRHRELPIEGVQFHPESVLTPEGRTLVANFVARCGSRA